MDKITAYAKSKVKNYELFYSKAEHLTAELMNDKIDFINEGNTHGLGVRVFIDGRLGVSYTNDLETFKQCVDNAIKIAKASKPDPFFKSFAKREKVSKVTTLNKKVRDLDAENVSDFSHAFVKTVKDVNGRIVVSSGSFVREVEEVHVVNSEGVDFFEISSKNLVYSYLSLEQDGKMEQTAHDIGSRDLLKANGKEDALRLLRNFDKKTVPTKEYTVTMLPQAIAGIFEASYAHAVNAENVQFKKSSFTGKLKEQVFPSFMTVTDDAISDNLYASRSADAEGTPSRKMKVIKKGVLQGFLHNSYTAYRESVASTGNAYRALGSNPEIAPNNVVISGGKAKDVIKEMDRGIVLRTLLGTHTMNSVSGDFSLGILEGYYVEKGEIKHPLKDAMVAGNFFKMVNNVTAMNKRQEHVLEGNGGFYLPAMLVSQLKVIGKD